MNISKIISVALIILTAFFYAGYKTNLLSWGLFNYFSNLGDYKDSTVFDSFDPERDILYLPERGDKDLFSSINDLSICRDRDVRKFLYIYLTSGRAYTIRSIENSGRYHERVIEIFKKYPEIPEDIALLPLLESGYNPLAVSKSRAIGLWQIVDNTAGPLGLVKDNWHDERRDIEKSTEAALRHLKNLYGCFKSWELALASYNGGLGYVSRLMQSTGAKNLEDLKKNGLRTETSEFVARYTALALIYKNQRLFGIKDEIKMTKAIKSDIFHFKRPVKLAGIAKHASVSQKAVMELNPEINSASALCADAELKIRIPAEAIVLVEKNLDKIYLVNQPVPKKKKNAIKYIKKDASARQIFKKKK
jgi:membrane-bound lytic murein transglycosylase D